jgi:hypothetical protein
MPPVNFSSPGKNLAALPLQRRSERCATVFLGEVQQHGAVDIARVDLFQALEAALFPVTEQVTVQEAGPAGAAFEERHAKAGRGTPPRNIALQAAWLAAAKWPIWL